MLGLAALVARAAVPAGGAAARALGLGAASVLVATALDPVVTAALPRAAAAAGTAAVLVWLADGTARLPAVALAAGALALGSAGGARLVARLVGDAGRARLAALAGLALAGTAPVWLGGVAEAAGGTAVDVVVAASPLSYLAAAAGHDWLRDPWLYTHSPIGSLRFAYPALGPATVAWIALGLACVAAARRANPTREVAP
jgi:hypothetical protein